MGYESANANWEKLLDTPPNSSTGYFLEVDLEYPVSLHQQQNDYPLAPEKMAVTKDMMSPYQLQLVEDLELGAASFNCKQLVPNLMPNSDMSYTTATCSSTDNWAWRSSKSTKSWSSNNLLGWAPYIKKNTQLRKTAKNDFEKDFFKLVNNAVSHSWISPFSLFQ